MACGRVSAPRADRPFPMVGDRRRAHESSTHRQDHSVSYASNEEGVVIINQSDFHQEKHELVEVPKKSEKGEKDGKSDKKKHQWA